MNEAQKKPRSPRKNLDYDSEIAAAEAKVKSLIAAKKENEKRELERNRQAIAALLKEFGWDGISVDRWIEIAPQLEALLTPEAPERKPKKAKAEAKTDPAEYQQFKAAA